jgi:cytochrome c biogenesis protein CcmG, thiol:disulfide interchange protein DsbE
MADAVGTPRRSFIVVLPLLVFGAVASLFLSGLFGRDKAQLPSTLIGRPSPDVALPALNGLVVTGSPLVAGSLPTAPGAVPGFGADDLRKGGVTLVNVFASWCAPCHAEHPQLMELSKDTRFRIFGINQKDSPDNARRFLGSKGNPYAAVGIDPNGRASIEWGVYGVPESFIIKGDGTIVHKLVGPLTEGNFAAFKAEIEKALR